MGRKRDLTDDEMAKIVNWLSEGYKTIEIAKMVSRDHCTIKRFVSVSLQGRQKNVEKKIRKLTTRDLRRIKQEVSRNPLASRAIIFKNCNLPGLCRSTRCKVLCMIGKVRKAENQPPLNNKHKQKRQEWGKTLHEDRFFKGVVDGWDESDTGWTWWVGPWLDCWPTSHTSSTETPARWGRDNDMGWYYRQWIGWTISSGRWIENEL